MLYILTSKQVLRTFFTRHILICPLFCKFSSFLFHFEAKKEKNELNIKGSTALRCYSLMQKQMILTSERHVEHPLAGPNTTINRRKTLEKENEEERPIVRTLYITVIAFTTQQVF